MHSLRRSSSARGRPVALQLVALETRIAPATVTDPSDKDDYDPSKPQDWAGPNGLLSLPEAIRQVNESGEKSITFGVPQVTISTTGLLPITKKVTITGQTSGDAPNTVLNGSDAQEGLTLTKGGTVSNLVIQAFSGYGLFSSGQLDLSNCYIGTSKDGTSAVGNGGGGVYAGKGGMIKDCVIAGNNGDGIFIKGKGTVQNNKIGTDAEGKQAVANKGVGVSVYGGSVTVKGNVVSGNEYDGVGVHNANGVKVLGNKIGVDVDGQNALPNEYGVFIGSFAKMNTVGGTDPADRNIISGNRKDGVLIEMAGAGNKVLGNYIGLAADGSTAVANQQDGVAVRGAPKTTIGGTDPQAENLIAGNGRYGVRVAALTGFFNVPVSGTKVIGNSIGLDASGDAKANDGGGVMITEGAQGTTVGGPSPGARNVISGNGEFGVALSGSGVSSNKVQGNRIGTDADGTAARRNQVGVVLADGAANNQIGGSRSNFGNLISGNAEPGIRISGAGTDENTISGNLIGTDADGSTALANGGAGIQVDGGGLNNIGGRSSGSRNIISGNGAAGVYISEGTALQILGNYIGLNAAGSEALPNAESGVDEAGGTGTLVGGPLTPKFRNVISGNDGHGVLVHGSAVGTNVWGNYIGTNAAGTVAVGNGTGVMVRDGASASIGSSLKNYGNLISGNRAHGIEINSTGFVTVERNYIGTDRTAKNPLPNQGHGVYIKTAIGHKIGNGGPDGANVIAYNGLDGVFVELGGGNSILANLIFNNGGRAIRVTGASNVRVDAPVITSATYAGGFITITGTVANRTSQNLRIELFGNATPGRDGGGQGTVFLGALTKVKTDANGTFTAKFKRKVPGGFSQLAITATDMNAGGGDQSTSEFSAIFTI